MNQNSYRQIILDLLEDSPIEAPDVIRDIRESLAVGEEGLAFDTLCSWIYEDALPIDRSYHARLASIADDMESTGIVDRLRELIVDDS